MAGAQRPPPSGPLFATRHRGLKQQLSRLARTLDSVTTVLILGAPGTGKDRLARLLHERSRRRAEPFIRIDLAAIPDDLFESELFGHERGAFTGAVSAKPGLLEGTGDGTVYLDRIDVLSPRAQGKLLRVVEERLFRRVGGTRPLSLRARLVASAAPDLPRRARTGEFREDLFYRLAVVTVHLPTLAERRVDVLAGVRAAAREAGGPNRLTPAAEAMLRDHPWRGNWREMENVVRRASIEARESGATALDVSHLRTAGPGDPEALLVEAARSGWTLRRLSDAYIDAIFEESGGNVAEAARRLGIARKTLYERRRGRP